MRKYLGILVCLDGLMNIVLEDVEEYENSKLLGKYNEILLRGNNGYIIFFLYIDNDNKVLHVTAKNLKKA